MDLARAMATGAIAGFGIGMFTALVRHAAVETSLFRALVVAVLGAFLGLFAFSLNQRPKTADQRSGDPHPMSKR